MRKWTERSSRHTIRYGSESIPLLMEFRAVKRLSISVHPDKRVTVSAPVGNSLDEVLSRVQRRARWIVKQQAYFDQYQPTQPPKKYISGETHRYLGRQYRLKVVESAREEVKLVGRYLWVNLPRKESSAVQQLLTSWYRERAKTIFVRHLDYCLSVARSLKLTKPELRILKLKKRWGSCLPAGKIILNVDLVTAPVHCIDYVIMHELCHLRIHRHDQKFYNALSRLMPDWRSRKARLESVVI